MDKYSEGDEPIPGYRLVELVGMDGLGFVWKATGPGASEFSIKIVGPIETARVSQALHMVRRDGPVDAIWLLTEDGAIRQEIQVLDANARYTLVVASKVPRPRE